MQEAAKEHDSCTNNLYNALAELDLALAEDPRYGYYTPAPFNLWMNVADQPDESGYAWVMPPQEQKAGDYCVFRAEEDLVAAFSACPWDIGEPSPCAHVTASLSCIECCAFLIPIDVPLDITRLLKPPWAQVRCSMTASQLGASWHRSTMSVLARDHLT